MLKTFHICPLMNTTKKGVRVLAETCRDNGIRKVVFSPGSRSAPLYIAFSQMADVECIVIPDERVAGYFALGMAQQLGKPVAVVCTSGTAALNLYPAVCEAYYQQVPLLILTADRPEGFANMGENQSIQQHGLYQLNSGFYCSVNGEAEKEKDLKEIAKQTYLAINETNVLHKGPSHINVHLDEPLYELTDEKIGKIKLQTPKEPKPVKLSASEKKKIFTKFSRYNKIMVIVGMHDNDPAFTKKLAVLNRRKDVAILHETTSNLNLKDSVWNIDAALSVIKADNKELLMPQLIITLGKQIVSKKIKQFLKDKVQLHWDIPVQANDGGNKPMFGKLDKLKDITENDLLEVIIGSPENHTSSFKRDWLDNSRKAAFLSTEYLAKVPYSDLKVFETLVRLLPVGGNIQYGNSTPVRYSNLFPHSNFGVSVNSNRGTSGIDGCVSTAAGAAYVNKKTTVSIVGDISFFYDSNALWNNYLSPGLRIVVINNSGGNVFRLIEGPTKIEGFEKFFETKHELTAKHLASMYDIPYYFCDRQNELEKTLHTFYHSQDGKPAILEIKTDGVLSAEVYRNYFKFLAHK